MIAIMPRDVVAPFRRASNGAPPRTMRSTSAHFDEASAVAVKIFLAATVTNLTLSRNDSSDLMSNEAA